METKHTKGEWRVSKEPFSLLITHKVNEKAESICQISQRYKPEEEQIANAKLIAASPELLESLIMIKMGGLGNFTKEEQEKINNAIKKATE